MSDYMFMLDSHLSPGQARVVAAVDEAARQASASVFLVGGAMRDMLGGFPITDLDFAVQDDALALANRVVRALGAKITSVDELRQTAELISPEEVTVEIGLSRTERHSKPGGKAQIEAAPIQQDLLRRDFTVNSIALSLSRASRGLLLDPGNGLADLQRKELRANYSGAFYDDPVRLLRLIRLGVRLGFSIEQRTRQQYETAKEAGVERLISPRVLFGELRQISNEPNGAEVLAAFEKEHLMELFSPALAASRLNGGSLSRLQKARQLVPFGAKLNMDRLALLMYFLTEKLPPKEKTVLIKRLQMTNKEIQSWTRLESVVKPVQKSLKASALNRPSKVYEALRSVPGEQVIFLYLHSSDRLVHDRVRNYLQKYLPAAQEVTDKDVIAAGFRPGTRTFARVKDEMIAAKLDGRTWKPEGAKMKPVQRPASPALIAPSVSRTRGESTIRAGG